MASKSTEITPSLSSLSKKGFPPQFAFYHIPESHILKIIQGIDSSNTYQKDNIPPKLLKGNMDICSIIQTNDVCRCIENGTFPDNLKNADITPTFKKDDHLIKVNYIPISILPTLSKIYEITIQMQMYEIFKNIYFPKFMRI